MVSRSTTTVLLVAGAFFAACSDEPAAPPTAGSPAAPPPGPPPNVLFIVWDTTRADRVSAHGYEKETTPFLASWAAENARVFDDCISTGSSTVPSHGSMFTGLLPCEHGANNGYNYLDSKFDTLAEIFRRGGYRTYAFAANPHIDSKENFVQGFDLHEHPYDAKHRERAFEIIKTKINPEDESSELARKLVKEEDPGPWALKAAGELAEEALVAWLAASSPDKPFFAFLNYLEAHRQFIPPERYRRRFMNEEQVYLSYKADRSWPTMWSYTLGMHEYTPEELEVMALTYDACVYELDQLFASLIGTLEAKGHLDNTVVVLTGDHGEHLGEHHMLDHQFSLYQGLVHVPMVLAGPGVTPGRTGAPVQNYDVFPTLLELARLTPPPGLDSKAVSLLHPDPKRQRIAEYPSPFKKALSDVLLEHPGFDPQPFDRKLRALFDRNQKLIWGEDGRHELYDLKRDPHELNDLTAWAPRREVMLKLLASIFSGIDCFDPETDATPPGEDDPRDSMTAEERAERSHMLEQLGYAGDDDNDDEEEPPPAPPGKKTPGDGGR
jgi:arylsulfatase A-like enzyme